ncbi:hypothetical protein MLD38_003795 [Melastoma candidum]|uniref:Uncharacterized protein n=1 Tax=Melastoma candidum TaxID=119954 RepID=A0ACB9S524_9MYRT|nr:hypothetical protein MLD38_003795 [Melastoma candidum]
MAESENSEAVPSPSQAGSYHPEEASRRDPSSISGAIDSSNIGYKLLKKHGWKEGTGLGIYEQGILEPVETYVKNNKRGVGAEKLKKNIGKQPQPGMSNQNTSEEEKPPKRTKALSKKLRRMQELEKKLQEKEFQRAFFREFWPDNV